MTVPNDDPTPLTLACEHCDALYTERPLQRGQIASCRGCGQVLRRGRPLSADSFLALAIAAMVVFVLANVYPLVAVEVRGQRNEATLWHAIVALARGPLPYVATAAFVTVSMLLVPALQIVLLAWVAAFARSGRRAPGMAFAMRTLERLRPWSMVEVFVIGALVSIVKLSAFLEVIPGVGLASLLALTMLITLLAGQRARDLWQ